MCVYLKSVYLIFLKMSLLLISVLQLRNLWYFKNEANTSKDFDLDSIYYVTATFSYSFPNIIFWPTCEGLFNMTHFDHSEFHHKYYFLCLFKYLIICLFPPYFRHTYVFTCTEN